MANTRLVARQWRQGDLLVELVDAPGLLQGKTLADTGRDVSHGGVTVALGETTGHAHVLCGDMDVVEVNGVFWALSLSDAGIALRHVDREGNPTGEHAPIEGLQTPPGTVLKVTHQREYDPWEARERQVWD